VVIRPEHLDVEPVGPAGGAAAGGLVGRVTARRFAGSELLFRVGPEAADLAVWVEAGPHAREIGLGDRVRLHLRATSSVVSSPPAGA
jgi:hypothetical protein